jgi:hypothetical protein
MFYITLFLGFVYLKIFRVRVGQEKIGVVIAAEGFLTIVAFLGLLIFGFMTLTWYIVLISSLLFFIAAALMVVAVQLGIFVDGKPVLVLSTIYKITPLLALVVIAGTAVTITL